VRLKSVGYYGSEDLHNILHQREFLITDYRRGRYVYGKLRYKLEEYLDCYERMIEIAEKINETHAANMHASELGRQYMLLCELGANLESVEKNCVNWLPLMCGYAPSEIDALRKRADALCRRSFRAMLYLISKEYFYSHRLLCTSPQLWHDHPLCLDVSPLFNDPLFYKKNYLFTLKKIKRCLFEIDSWKKADENALALVGEVAYLKRLKRHLHRLTRNGATSRKISDPVWVELNQQIAAEQAKIDSQLANIHNQLMSISPLLQNSLDFYREVLHER
jgi:hypothetical protein